MITLRIEHKVSNFEGWRKAFDSDPIDRKKSGVKCYRIHRPVGDADFVMIDLDFDSLEQAQAAKAALQKIFPKIEGSLIFGVQINVLEVIEATEL